MAEVLILSAPDVARDLAAPVVWEHLDGASDPVLGAAEGSMPEPLYRALDRRRGGRDVSRTTVFTLDAHASPPGGHHLESYGEVPCSEIAEPLGLDPARVPMHRAEPDGLQGAGECHEAAITTAASVGLQTIDNGTDGRLRFIDPASSPVGGTCMSSLTVRSPRGKARFFDSVDIVPGSCVTHGLGAIRGARRLVLLAFGDGKTGPVAAGLEGQATASAPQSMAQLHPRAVAIDPKGPAYPPHYADYYRPAAEHKLAWEQW